MKRKRILGLLLTAVIAGLMVFSGGAYRVKAADITTEDVYVQYDQFSSRYMLDMINEFRTGSDAWEYDFNGQKVYKTGLKPLEYDAELEKVAMLRAVEIIKRFEHRRPNDTMCDTAITELGITVTACGENIAYGQRTPEEVFMAWREDDEPYEGQGHRRNMLSEDFNTIGIGHLYYNGQQYWVQEFGKKTVVPTTDNPLVDYRTVSIKVDTDAITRTKDGFSYQIVNGNSIFITECTLTGDVVIPSSIDGLKVTKMAEQLFANRSGITSVTLPVAMERPDFYDYMFLHCNDLKAIYVEPGNIELVSIDGVLYSRDGKCLIAYPAARAGASYTVYSGTTELWAGSFSDAANLTDLYLPDIEIGLSDRTFSHVPDLTVHYPDGGKAVKNLHYYQEYFDTRSAFLGVPLLAPYTDGQITIPAGPQKDEFDLFHDGYNDNATYFDPIEHYITADAFTKGIYSVYVLGNTETCSHTYDTVSGIVNFLNKYRVYEEGSADPIDIHFFIYDYHGSPKASMQECIDVCLGSEWSKRIHYCDISIYDKAFPKTADGHKGLMSLLDHPFSYCSPFVEFVTPEGKEFTVLAGSVDQYYFYDTISEMAKFSVKDRTNPQEEAKTEIGKDASKKAEDDTRSNPVSSEKAFKYTVMEDGTAMITKCYIQGDIVIPEVIDGYTVTKMDTQLFFEENGITSVTLPASMKEPEYYDNNFTFCWDLEAIYVDPANTELVSVDGVLYSRNGKDLIAYPAARKGSSYTVFEGTENYWSHSFCAVKELKDLYLANPDADIIEYTFDTVSGLTVHYLEGGKLADHYLVLCLPYYETYRSALGSPRFEVYTAGQSSVPAAPSKELFDRYNDGYNENATEYDPIDHFVNSDAFATGIYSVYLFGDMGRESYSYTHYDLFSIADFLEKYRVYEKGTSTPIDIHFFIYDVYDSPDDEIAECIETCFGKKYSSRIHIAKKSVGDVFVNPPKDHKSIARLVSNFTGFPFVEFVTPDGQKFATLDECIEAEDFYKTISEMAEYAATSISKAETDAKKNTTKDDTKKVEEKKVEEKKVEEKKTEEKKVEEKQETKKTEETAKKAETSKTKTVSKPAKQTVSSAKSSAKGKLTVKWKKNTKADGYQIEYSNQSDFSSSTKVTVSKNSTVSKTISGLKSGKKYYVRVRSYVLDENGKKVYGTFSAKKSVTVK